MFVDQVKIDVKAGNGGNGMVAFRREKYVPNGGPAGGDGGRGGNVIFKVDSGMNTLMDFRYHRKFKAKNGGNGANKSMTGRSAEDLVIPVPEGTTVTNTETGQVIGDLTKPDQELVVAKAGRGGRGNIHFASPTNPAPEIAENGEPGQEISLSLELKVLADVGLVGFPSAGKSTLLSVITSAKPKIAGYHFTTLVPNLGMVRLDDGRDFAVADLPGLVEGASNGVGLGFQFLRHVERTRVILHLVDMSGVEGRDPFEDYLAINKELSQYDERILNRPQIIVATKMDLPDSEANLADFKQKLAKQAQTGQTVPEIFPISSVTHTGLTDLIRKTADLLDTTSLADMEEPEDTTKSYDYEPADTSDFKISYDKEYESWVISGDKIERLFKMTDTEHDQSMLRFARQMHGMGIDDALRKAGAKDGDTVSILDFSFTYVE
ncbi:GTPase ObgE [Lentilactobacillus parabuchneri]|jgi:GTP-binding protein|uniref:GTPase Obg n=2 Tax=Lentilactobacillus parabuchneri TaxID=152331 RepID=A0A1X1FHU3_9LACO|nr:GTPase ObgE [Lentilactobacillus parabuchneri]APR06397.1 GTPase ObgE [Lentilactobacillus parabuchneri]KRM46320.1 Obg family GTPase CgtA [Lentilactobacillus parabuchneri DSM 5707 = NBRC 107865]KRN79780.1 Obg family GTPase CgtA [Lentilactobacillus parabuchneri]MBW0223230.1 GTPase ObgE [Lentilactobacillus parabuchneri]MBW0246293.1 GTPase ObgE [Lentilactobacillus parabuchneri]